MYARSSLGRVRVTYGGEDGDAGALRPSTPRATRNVGEWGCKYPKSHREAFSWALAYRSIARTMSARGSVAVMSVYRTSPGYPMLLPRNFRVERETGPTGSTVIMNGAQPIRSPPREAVMARSLASPPSILHQRAR